MTVSTWLRGFLRKASRSRRRIPRRPRRSTLLWEVCEPRTLLASSLSIDDVHVMGVNSGTVDAMFTVTLSPPDIEHLVTVDYSTADGTAVEGRDYTRTSGTLSFLPGDSTQTIVVQVLSDTLFETDELSEFFTVNLSNPTFAVIGKGQGIGTIDDTAVPGATQFSVQDYSVREDAGTATITVIRTGGGASGVSVNFATGGGTAVPNVDYIPTSGMLTFGAGELSKTFSVTVLHNDAIEGNRRVDLTLSPPSGGAIPGPRQTSRLTIIDIDSTVVTNTLDQGLGSLRQAILTSNATPGPNAITFDIPGQGPFTISPNSPLPAILDTATIDATTQPGYAGTPIVELNGSGAGNRVSGLAIVAGNSAVLGLDINRFQGSAILVEQGGGNGFQANYLGTDITGTRSLANLFDGISILDSANNTIGGTANGARNLISGNGLVGVRISGAGATGNIVEGNLIGTDITGGQRLGNAFDGVFVDHAAGNTIGGSTRAARNIISGNGAVGIQIFGASAARNFVWGNLIGTDATGTRDLGNAFDGVFLNDSPNNTIGGVGAADRNVISGNNVNGIRIAGVNASGNAVLDNFIGTDATGATALGNTFDGIFINGSPNNTIGGAAAGAGNLISGNGSVGIQIFGATAAGNQVLGNFIGTDVTGTQAVGNRRDGVYINGAPNNRIGGATAGEGNLISGNGSSGLQLFTLAATGNVVQGNLIGTDINGQPRLGNAFGLFINRAINNTIGGTAAGARNVIAGNRVANIFIGTGANSLGVANAARRLLGRATSRVGPRSVARQLTTQSHHMHSSS